MRPSSLIRLTLAGTRTDTLRVALTALASLLAALAVLAAANVLAVATPDGLDESPRYTSALLREPGLRPGVATALLLLTIPVLALAGQAARVGAPARDQRLAAFRLTGATPRQARGIAVAETGTAALLGSVAGLGLYLLLHTVLHRPDAQGRLMLPTDVTAPLGAVLAVLLGLPLLAAAVTALALRRVVLSPLGVTRRAGRTRGPRPWPGVLIVLGVAAFAGLAPLLRLLREAEVDVPDGLVPAFLFGGAALAVVGVVLGTGWISFTAGRVLHRHARGAPALLAARRLTADPWHGSRTLAALLTAAVFAGGAASMRAYFTLDAEAKAASQQAVNEPRGSAGTALRLYEADRFYLDSMNLVDAAVVVGLVIAVTGLLVALAEAVTARRRTNAALAAAGVPRQAMGRALAWQLLAPAVPALLLALTVGSVLGRGFGGEVRSGGYTTGVCEASEAVCADPEKAEEFMRRVDIPEIVREVPVPLEQLALYGLGTTALLLAAVGLARLFLRGSASVEELRAG